MIDYHSPCVHVCSLEKSDTDIEYCAGCKRTIEEIFKWMTYTEEERKKINKELKDRKL